MQQNTPFSLSGILKLGVLETWDVNVLISEHFGSTAVVYFSYK